MPQGRQPTLAEFLQQPPTAQQPSLDEFLKRPIPGRQQSAQAPAAPPQQPQQPEESFLSNLYTAAGHGATKLAEQAVSLADIVGNAATGNFQPLMNAAESAGRGATSLAGYITAGAPPDPRIAQLAQQEAQRRANDQDFQNFVAEQAAYEKYAAQNPSVSNRVARFLGSAGVQAVPYIGAGIAGGGLPAMTAIAAAQSAPEPQNLAVNLAAIPILGAAGELAGKALSPILKRIRSGEPVADAVSAEVPSAGQLLLPPGPKGLPNSPIMAGASPIENIPQSPAQQAIIRFSQAVQDIDSSGLSPTQKSKAFRDVVESFGKEQPPPPEATPTVTETPQQSQYPRQFTFKTTETAPNVRETSVQTQYPRNQFGYGPEMTFPENPNPVQQAGFLPRVFEETATPAAQSTPDTVFQGLKNSLRTPTSPVSLSGLRDQFPGMPKQEFDDAILQSAKDGEIVLHRTDNPGNLSAAERNAMVTDGKGNYFIGATLSEPEVAAMQSRASSASVNGPSLESNFTAPSAPGGAGTPPRPPAFGIDEPFPPQWEGHPAQQALFQATDSLPKRVATSIVKNGLEGYRLQRAVLASGDLSAPFRQGALITMSPQQWVNGTVPRATARMFQAFNEADYQRINSELLRSVEGQTGQQFGLSLTEAGGGLGKAEEVFISRLARGIPITKQSEQAYTTFMNSIRVERFGQIMRSLQKLDLPRAELDKGLAAAADWVNDATGRGSFAKFGKYGKNIDQTFPALGEVIFAPRNVASRLNTLNPLVWFRGAMSGPAGRIVMYNRLSDVAQFAATVAGVYQLAKAAGASVETNSDSPDFLKIRFGTWRYDPLAGMQQIMRLVAKTAEAVGAVAEGEKLNGKQAGQQALDASWRFIRGKLAPVPKFFIDWLTQKTVTGQPFDMKKAAIEQIAPMQWNDWVNAYLQEGLPGVLKATPGVFGVGVQNYAENPGNVVLNDALNQELLAHGINASSVQQLPGDTEDTQKARAQKVEGWLNSYGQQLMANPRYQQLTKDQQTAALTSLQKRITEQANMKRPDVSGFKPVQIVFSVLQNEREKPYRNRQLIVQPPTP